MKASDSPTFSGCSVEFISSTGNGISKKNRRVCFDTGKPDIQAELCFFYKILKWWNYIFATSD